MTKNRKCIQTIFFDQYKRVIEGNLFEILRAKCTITFQKDVKQNAVLLHLIFHLRKPNKNNILKNKGDLKVKFRHI